MRSREYWERRARESKLATLSQAERQNAIHDRAWRKVERELLKEIAEIQAEFGGDIAKAKSLLIGKSREQALAQYYKLVDKALGSSGAAKEKIDKLLSGLNNTRKLSRLKARVAQLDVYGAKMYTTVAGGTQGVLNSVAKEAYLRDVFAMQSASGSAFDFEMMDADKLRQLTNQKWANGYWSDSIWGHIESFDEKLKQIITEGIMKGSSYERMAQELHKLTGAAMKDCRRIVRTEAVYVSVQTDLKKYEGLKINFYNFLGGEAGDTQSCDLCKKLNGQVFPVSEATVGLNCPPIHPNCRCCVSAAFPEDEEADENSTLNADAEAAERGKVPEDMTFEEWKAKYGDGGKKGVEKGADGGIIKNKESENSRVDTAQEIVNAILKKELSGVRFTKSPTVTNSNAYNGCTKAIVDSTGTVLWVKCILIGKQQNDSLEELINTLLHEELEARILLARKGLLKELNAATDDERHRYIESVIERFFALKGWKR